MKILYLSPTAALAGAERVLLDVVRSVGRAEPSAEQHLIAFREGPVLEEARARGAAVQLVPMPPTMAERAGSQAAGWGPLWSGLGLARRAVVGLPSCWGFVRRLRRAVEALNPDVIHSNGIESHLLTRPA